MGRCGVLLMMFRIKSLLLFAIVLTLGAVYFSWEILSVPDEPKLDDILRAHKKFSTITIRRKGGECLETIVACRAGNNSWKHWPIFHKAYYYYGQALTSKVFD